MSINKHKSRGLEELERSFPKIKAEIDSRIESSSPVKILEIGCGYGMALLDLSHRYGTDVILHGINRSPDDGKAGSIKKKAAKLFRHSQTESLEFALPKIHYFDVCRPWPLGDNTFDFIYTQHAFLHFEDKILVLEEISRILKPDGVAYIDLQVSRSGNVARNSIVIDSGGRTIPFRDHALHFKNLEIDYPERSLFNRLGSWTDRLMGRNKKAARNRAFLKLRKAENLDFGLELVSSIPFSELYPGRKGCQSLYRLKAKTE